VSRQRRPSQNWHWGPKLPQMQNLGGRFVVIFLKGPKSQLYESLGVKTTIKPLNKSEPYILCVFSWSTGEGLNWTLTLKFTPNQNHIIIFIKIKKTIYQSKKI